MSEIRIESKPVSLGLPTPFDHLYLVFVDNNGAEFVLRGGPANNNPLNWGAISIELGVPIAMSEDNRPIVDRDEHGSRVLDLGERDPEAVWVTMLNHANLIALAALPYAATSQNSNSFVASALHVVGLDVSNWLPDTAGIDDYPADDNILDSISFNLVGGFGDFGTHNDILWGGQGDDILSGNGGDDVLAGKQGGDTLDGGDGWDVADYHDSAAGIDIDLTRQYQVGGDAQGDHLLNIEEILGSAHNDVLRGGPGDNILRGEGGDDTFYGSAGADRLFGGDDNDIFHLDVFGKEFAVGGAGNDVFIFDNLSPLAPMDPTIDFGDLAGTLSPTVIWGGAGADELRFVNSQNTPYSSGQIFVVYDPSLTEENVTNLDFAKLREYYHDEVVQAYNGYPPIIVVNPDADDFITYNGHRFGAVDVGIVKEDIFTDASGHEIGSRYYGYEEGGWGYDPLIYQDTSVGPSIHDWIWLREATGYDVSGYPDGYPRVQIWGFRNGDFGIDFNSVAARHEYKDATTNWQWASDGGDTAFTGMFDTNSRFSFPISTFTLDPEGQRMAMAASIGSGAAGGVAAGETGVVRHVAGNDVHSAAQGLASADAGDVPAGDGRYTDFGAAADSGAAPAADYIRFEGAIGIALADTASNDNHSPGDFWYEPEPIGALV